MQTTNSKVCDGVNVGLYKQIKPPLVGEHAFPLTGFVCMAAHVILLLFIKVWCVCGGQVNQITQFYMFVFTKACLVLKQGGRTEAKW